MLRDGSRMDDHVNRMWSYLVIKDQRSLTCFWIEANSLQERSQFSLALLIPVDIRQVWLYITTKA